MSIVNMNRIDILALAKDKKSILKRLQQIGCVEVEQIPEQIIPEGFMLSGQGQTSDVAKLEKLDWAINILSKYDTTKAPLFGNLPKVKEEDVANVLANEDKLLQAITFLEDCEKARGDIKSQLSRINAEKEQILPWLNLTIDPESIKDSHSTYQRLGSMPTRDLANLQEKFTGELLYIEQINVASDISYVLIVAHKSLGDSFLTELRGMGFSQETAIRNFGIPKEYLKQLNKKEGDLANELNDVSAQEASRADIISDLKILYDALCIDEQRRATENKFISSQSTFYAQGWVPEALGEKVRQEMVRLSPSAQIKLRPPLEDETPPVLLSNNSLVEPFESVVASFSLPIYTGLDPTKLMMPFFINFFGMMVSDAGYGLLMALLIPIIIKFFNPSKGAKNLMKLLAIGGVATVVWGFLFNTWFGFSPLPVLFDAVNNPIPVMVVCLGLGVLHLFAGLGAGAYLNIKRGKPLDAIYDQLSWILLVTGVGLMLLPKLSQVGKYMALSGVLIILLTAGRDKGKNPIKRLMGGLGALYGVSSWLSDILSYMRLFGMGLATGVIGMVMNKLVAMVFSAGFIGMIIGSVLFVALHLFNAGINVLGAYVHTCRLQYIEFFSKFYEEGGAEFSPLRTKTRYVNIHNVEG